MSRKGYNFLDYGIEEDIDPKIKFNSLISVTVSTIMCLAAKCPLPKSNVETTRLFLSAIKDDNGETPRNIKGFLSLLTNYTGPYESDSSKEKSLEKALVEKTSREKDSKASLESDSGFKISMNQMITTREVSSLPETQSLVKRTSKGGSRKNEKETSKKSSKNITSKISSSKSIISKF